jgi:hypothetical protein
MLPARTVEADGGSSAGKREYGAFGDGSITGRVWIAPCYGHFCLGVRFCNYEHLTSLIFYIFQAVVNNGQRGMSVLCTINAN